MSGPSGSGKGTLIKKLLSERKDIGLSISATTRLPRAGEVDTRDYHFLTEKEFRQKIDEGEFLEWARVHGFFYGTLRSEVEKKLKTADIILEIDPQGAFQVKQQKSDAVLIFIKPPSLDALRERLKNRGTESEEAITRRLSDAQSELDQVSKYDYVIINDYVDRAGRELAEVIDKERLKKGDKDD